MVARWAHNPKVVGSNPAPATKSLKLRLFLFRTFFIMYFVYVLYSLKDHRLYKGFTSNIQKRLIKHNSGGSTSTAKRKPFVLIHIEQFEDKTNALKRELFLKTLEGGTQLKLYLQKQHILDEHEQLTLGQW